MKKISAINKRAAVRHGRLRYSSAFLNILRALVSVFLALTISVTAVIAYALMDLTHSFKTVQLETEVPLGVDPFEGAFNMLVVGSDSREGLDPNETGELNDVTILLHIAADHKSMTAISIPRDLLVEYPSCPGPKGEKNYYSARSGAMINEALSNGLPCVVKVVENLTGAKIPFAGMVTFSGVVNMSNAIGGVQVCVEHPIVDVYTGVNLPAGQASLVGQEALAFLRSRHGISNGGDLARISNQQIFLSALARKIKSGDTLTDPFKGYAIAKSAVENMTLSKNMASVDFMRKIMATLKTVDLEHTTFVQYPSFPAPSDSNRVIPDERSAKILMRKVLNDEDFEVQHGGSAVAQDDTTSASSGTSTGTQSRKPATGNSGSASNSSGSSETGTGSGQNSDNGQTTDGAPGTSQSTKLPENVTGQKASQVTCSVGSN